MFAHRFTLPALLAAGVGAGFVASRVPAAAGGAVELEEAEVFIEWNSTDSDFGIHFFWDGEPWRRMKVLNADGRTFLAVEALRNLRAQGLTEGFFESAEPPTSELPLSEFLDRFPEGEYAFVGETLEGDAIEGEAEFSHVLPAPPAGLSPAAGDVVSRRGFEVSFDPVTEDTDGNGIEVAFYEVAVENLDDEPFLRAYKVILRPTQTSVGVPAEFLEAEAEYKFEVIAVLEGGNRTITESGTFSTD